MYPALGHIHGITLHTYGTVLMASMVLVYGLAIRRRDPTLLQRHQIDDLGLIVLVSVWVSGGLASLLLPGFQSSALFGNLAHLGTPQQGGTSQQMGTLSITITVATALSLYFWWKNLAFVRMADFLMPPFIVGYAVQRTLGCFSAGCCHGHPSDTPWAVTFPETAGIGPFAGVPVHPTQLYLGATAFLTYGLMRRWQARHPPHGTPACLGLIGLFGSYFGVAFFRGDMTATWQVDTMPTGQRLAAMACLIGIVGFIVFWKKGRS